MLKMIEVPEHDDCLRRYTSKLEDGTTSKISHRRQYALFSYVVLRYWPLVVKVKMLLVV